MGTRRGILDWVERIGDKLPEPTMLFVWCIVILMVLSQVGVWMGWSVQPVRPVLIGDGAATTKHVELRPEGERITCRSLLTSEGLYFALSGMVSNFINFPPLGV